MSLNEENLKNIWDIHLSKVNSPSVSVVLKHCKLYLDGEKIKIGTSGQVAAQTVKLEKELIEQLRDSFELRNVDVEIYIDKELQAEIMEQDSKPQTTADKLNHLKKTNEYLEQLIQNFDLKIVE